MATDPRRQRRPTFDSSLAWAALAVIAVAAIIGVAILLTRPAPVEAPTTTSSPGASVPPAAVQPERPSSVEEAAWWRIGWQGDAAEPIDFQQLSVGTVERGETVRIPFGEFPVAAGAPFVRGPAGGLVVVAVAEVRRTQLLVVEAATGDARDLVEVAPEALDVEVSRDGRTVLFLAETDAGLAAYALPIDGSGDVRRLTDAVPRVAGAPDVVLAAVRLPIADLVLDPAGEALAILDCDASCRLRVARLDGGEEIIFNLGGFESVLSWEGNVIALGSGRCLDLAAAAPMPNLCAGPEMPAVTGLEGMFAGVELPDGWRVELRRVGPGQQFRMKAVATGADGEEVVLEALGEFGGQG